MPHFIGSTGRRPLLLGALTGATAMWLAMLSGWIDGPAAKTFSYTKFAPIGNELGCKALASAILNEEVSLAEPNKYRGKMKVSAVHGTDTLSLKVEGTKLFVLSGADVQFGRTEADEMMIVRNDKRAVVAIKITPSANVLVVRLDRETGNAIWGKVGEFILGGQVGWVHYLECR